MGWYVPYSPAAHQALIALQCVVSKWPFNSVSDPFYAQEVQMLCPGTKLSSPSTVSCDILAMYENGLKIVKWYFSVSLDILCDTTPDPLDRELAGAVHLVIDGWTSPQMASYLGIVVMWFSGGMLHHWNLEILEFIWYIKLLHSSREISATSHIQFKKQSHQSTLG